MGGRPRRQDFRPGKLLLTEGTWGGTKQKQRPEQPPADVQRHRCRFPDAERLEFALPLFGPLRQAGALRKGRAQGLSHRALGTQGNVEIV